MNITSSNNATLFNLSTEFGFERLLSAVAIFQCSNGSEPQSNPRLRQLEERSAAQDRDIAALRREVALLKSSEQRLLEVVDRLGIVERELSRLKGDFGGLSAAVEAAVPWISCFECGFRRPKDSAVFKVVVVGDSKDRWRRLCLIEWAERFECGVSFEFLEMEAEAECEVIVPEETNGALICGGRYRLSPLQSNRTVRIGFVGAEVAADSEVMVDLRTGGGVGLALAALIGRSRDSSEFTFADMGRELRLSSDAQNGVNVFGRAEAAQTIRIVVEDNCRFIGGIWSPLFPRVTEISLPPDCKLSPRTFAGLRFSRIEVRGSASAAEALKTSIAAFDDTPWRITFGSSQSVESALSGRERDSILSVGGIVRPECFEWSSLRAFGDCAFIGARNKRIDFFPLSIFPARLGQFGFAHSSVEVVELPGSVVDLGEGCFFGCRFLRRAFLGFGVRILPNDLFAGCVSLREIRASNIEGIGLRAFSGTRSLRTFDFGCLAPSTPIAGWAFQCGGLSSVLLRGDPPRPCVRYAFSHCKSLREAAVNLAELPNCLFWDCSALEHVWMTARVSQIGLGAFKCCSALRNIDLSVLTSEAEIKTSAFAESGLVEVEFPAKLQSIGDRAFEGCAWLASVRLPRELGRIGREVFNCCHSLRRLALGDVRTWPVDAKVITKCDGKLDRLELIGGNLEDIPAAAIGTWLADDAVVVSSTFAGRRLGQFEIVSE
jgi:hypothetical protein